MIDQIEYVKGDATDPLTSGNKVIVHICNDIGGWGKGFVTAISRRLSEPEKQYRLWHKSRDNFGLGEVRFVQVRDDLWVANLIAQHKINKDEQGNPPIRYSAIQIGLRKVAEFAESVNASVHMPRIGCGLAGGTWDKVEPIIHETLSVKEISVTVYDF